MLATIANRLLSKALVRGLVCMSCVAGYEAKPIVDLRGTLATNGQYPMRDISLIRGTVIHHSATTGVTIRKISEYHVEERKWQGIGYHFAIGWDGTIYLLNDPGRKTNHTKDHNSRWIGVVLIGNYDQRQLTPEMIASMELLARHLCEFYGACDVKFHRDFKPTICPGHHAVTQLIHIRT